MQQTICQKNGKITASLSNCTKNVKHANLILSWKCFQEAWIKFKKHANF